MATVSLSKGVFAFKNSKCRSKKVIPDDLAKKAFIQSSEDNLGLLRRRNFHKCWQLIQDEVESLLDESHCAVFEELIQFLKTKGSRPLSILCKDIPAACLVTGVNMPDHDALFSSLVKNILREVSSYAVRLPSTDCGNLKTMISKTVGGFMDESGAYTFDDSDEEEDNVTSMGLKRNNCNLPVLSAWYEHKYATPRSPRKKQRISRDGKPPLVVIIENVEAVPSRVLADFVCLLSQYRHKVPVVMILGVSTTPSAVHNSLRQEASACIAMETFQSLPSTDLLAKIIEKVLMSPDIPIKIGGKAFKLLLDTFLYHDLSVKNFINGLKFLVLQHFLTSPGAFMCCLKDERETLLKALQTSDLASLRGLPSVVQWLKTLDEETKERIKKEKKLKKLFIKELEENDGKFKVFCILLKCLHVLVLDLPRKPLGRKLREILCLALSEPITESPEFKECWKLLSMSAKEELLPKLKEALTVLKLSTETRLAELTGNLTCLIHRLENLGSESACDSPTVPVPTSSPVRLNLKPTDRFNLREKLLEATTQMSSKPRTQFSIVREEILELLRKWFQENLKPPSEYVFHEAMCYNPPTSHIRFHLIGGFRAAVMTGLSDPQKYLKCSCCVASSTEQQNLSDLTICYKLHLECGRHINLFDWMQAFITIVSGANDENKPQRKGKKEIVDQTLQARFVQAASELQFLGFIKPTKRKTDHVQRLTWGGC